MGLCRQIYRSIATVVPLDALRWQGFPNWSLWVLWELSVFRYLDAWCRRRHLICGHLQPLLVEIFVRHVFLACLFARISSDSQPGQSSFPEDAKYQSGILP